MLKTRTQKNRGDTIVEALIALTIAAFAIGIAYATANRSLDQVITARERNQALNLIEKQITDLRIRYAGDTVANFKTNFGNQTDFCLDDNVTLNTDSNWVIYQNHFDAVNTVTKFRGGYAFFPLNTACERNISGEGATFYIDITTKPIPGQDPSINGTAFQIFVRWDRIGGGPVNEASLFYRPNGSG